jgi:osmoprotectant transport system ATP-binding protein
MLQLNNVTKTFDDDLGVRDVNLSVNAGETRALVGPSGAGKSTLLRLMAGLIQPDVGEILVDGTKMTKDNIRSLRLKMGYVIQSGGLFPHLTARDNATIVARTLKWPTAKIEARLEETMLLAQFPPSLLPRYPVELSGGEKQRLSVVRALFLDPKILLLDEPLGSLDPLTRQGVQGELKELFAKLQKTVVLVTHDLAEAAYFADLISIVMGGEVLQTGTALDLIKMPSHPFVTAFIKVETKSFETSAMERS